MGAPQYDVRFERTDDTISALLTDEVGDTCAGSAFGFLEVAVRKPAPRYPKGRRAMIDLDGATSPLQILTRASDRLTIGRRLW